MTSLSLLTQAANKWIENDQIQLLMLPLRIICWNWRQFTTESHHSRQLPNHQFLQEQSIMPSLFLNSHSTQQRLISHFMYHQPSIPQQNRNDFVEFNSKRRASQCNPSHRTPEPGLHCQSWASKSILAQFKLSEFYQQLIRQLFFLSIKKLEPGCNRLNLKQILKGFNLSLTSESHKNLPKVTFLFLHEKPFVCKARVDIPFKKDPKKMITIQNSQCFEQNLIQTLRLYNIVSQLIYIHMQRTYLRSFRVSITAWCSTHAENICMQIFSVYQFFEDGSQWLSEAHISHKQYFKSRLSSSTASWPSFNLTGIPWPDYMGQ